MLAWKNGRETWPWLGKTDNDDDDDEK